MTKVPMTIRGAEMLREELKKLKSDDRPKVIQAIAEARAHGDLKENAEYHAAKDQQGFIEGRIKEIEAKLSNTQIIDVTAIDAKGRVVFGSTVDLLDVQSDQQSRRGGYQRRPDFVFVADCESDDWQERRRRSQFFGTWRRETIRSDKGTVRVGAPLLQRQGNLRFLVVATINQCDVAYSRYQFCRSLVAKVTNYAVARLLVAGANADLDQFMVLNGGAEFIQQRV